MIESKRQSTDPLVKQINIEHDFDKFLAKLTTQYRANLALPNISDETLLQRLLDLKKDAMYFNLKSLLDFREIYYSKKEYIKTQIK